MQAVVSNPYALSLLFYTTFKHRWNDY